MTGVSKSQSIVLNLRRAALLCVEGACWPRSTRSVNLGSEEVACSAMRMNTKLIELARSAREVDRRYRAVLVKDARSVREFGRRSINQ